MSESYKSPIIASELTASEAIYGTAVAASTKEMVTSVLIANTTASDATIRLWFVPTSGSPVLGDAILYDVTVKGNDTLSFAPNQVIDVAGTIQAQANVGSGIILRVTSVVFTS